MTSDEAHRQASDLVRQGRIAEAVTIYRGIIAQDANNADAWNLLGVMLLQSGRISESMQFIRRAIQLNPRDASYRNSLALAFAGLGRADEAVGQYREALALRPEWVEIWESLGMLLRETGNGTEALAAYRKAAELRPADAGILHRLGSLLLENLQFEDAIANLKKARELQPGFYPALNNLGIALQRSGRMEEAISSFERGIAIQPDVYDLHHNLGAVLVDVGRWDRAIETLHRAIELKPQSADSYFRLGDAFLGARRFDQAIAAYRQAISLREHFPEAWHNLGNAYKDSGKIEEAIECYRRSIELGVNSFEVYGNLGLALRAHGDLDGAIASFRRAAEMQPCCGAAQNFLFTIHLHPDYNARRIYEEHARWNRVCARPLTPAVNSHSNERSPGRRLRVGYVSPDFCKHPIGALMVPVLSNHDHNEIEVYCYSNVPVADAMTARICLLANVWRESAHLPDEALSNLIREDRIDILVDLALHSEGSRLLMFARRPAPVQVTWLGYPSTSGLDAIDYRLSDPYLDPPALDRSNCYSEKTELLESFWCYDPLIDIPLAAGPPVEQNGFITFGCLNNSVKINDATLSIWAQVLRSVNGSRLTVLAPAVSRNHLASMMVQHGIDSSRIDFIDRLPREQYLDAYNRIDICLDTFPYCGHTTTLDATWMGSSVITLSGETAVSRGGASILSNAGFPELVATSVPRYVQIASELAQNVPRLRQMRPMLRERMKSSVLMDARRFSGNLERIYRLLWQRWCDQVGR